MSATCRRYASEFPGDPAALGLKARAHQIGGCLGILEMDGGFVEASAEIAHFESRAFSIGQAAVFSPHSDDPQGLFRGRKGKFNIESVLCCPRQDRLGTISPRNAERQPELPWLGGLPEGECGEGQPQQRTAHHPPHLNRPLARGKHRFAARGFALTETAIAFALLAVIGLVMLKISLNILAPRQWAMQQTLTDAYLTYERSYSERLPFRQIVDSNSPWPVFPATASSEVEIGSLPGGTRLTGTLVRTRMQLLGEFSDSSSSVENPSNMKVYNLQSVLTYSIGEREYVKSRSVIRSQ